MESHVNKGRLLGEGSVSSKRTQRARQMSVRFDDIRRVVTAVYYFMTFAQWLGRCEKVPYDWHLWLCMLTRVFLMLRVYWRYDTHGGHGKIALATNKIGVNPEWSPTRYNHEVLPIFLGDWVAANANWHESAWLSGWLNCGLVCVKELLLRCFEGVLS